MSDKYLGRYKTILGGSIIYAIGLFLCTWGAVPPHYEAGYFLPGLFLFITVGSGCIKPCVVTLGADQFDPKDPDQVEEKAKFFNYFYWAINLGATVSYGYLTHLALNGQAPSISEPWGFFASFLIPAVSFVIGIIVFVGGSPRYKHAPPSSSVLGEFGQIVYTAGKRSGQGKALLTGIFFMMFGAIIVVIGYFVHNETAHLTLAIGGMILILLGIVIVCYFGKHTTWLNTAADLPTTSCKVPDAAEVLRLSPYLGLLCIFWGVYGQMSNNFFNQGCQMDLRLGDGDDPALLSANLLNLFDTFVILVFVPIFDSCIYPAWERWTGKKLRPIAKMQAGFIFCVRIVLCIRDHFLSSSKHHTHTHTQVLAMICSAFVEIWRKRRSTIQDIGSNCDDVFIPMNSLSIWWQAPQFILVGISEILISISSYELFYSEVPNNMRSVCQALNLLTTSLGSMLTGGINSIFSSWLPDNLNDGKLELVYFFIAGLAFLAYLALRVVSAGFKYKKDDENEIDEEALIASGFSPPMSRASVSRSHVLKRRSSTARSWERRGSVPAIPVSPPQQRASFISNRLDNRGESRPRAFT